MIGISHAKLVQNLAPKVLQQGNTTDYLQIVTDSRVEAPGGLFWALKGEAHDGHGFVAEAVKKGCQGVVVSDPVVAKELPKDISVYLVSDTLVALQKLATSRARELKAKGCKIIGITGSSGKTTCKEFTTQIAHFAGLKVHSNKGSFNNHFGVPFNILSASDDTAVLICEMGMNHSGELTELAAIAQPDIVCCTMVGSAHIEHFGSIENIAKAKQEIYTASPEAVGVFNLSNPWTNAMFEDWRSSKGNRQTLTFMQVKQNAPKQEGVNIQLAVEVTPQASLMVSGWIESEAGGLEIPIFGAHHVTNIMAAAAINLFLKVEPKIIWQALPNLKTPWGRTQLVSTASGAGVLFDAYNANPESMQALMEIVQGFHLPKRKFAILGEMKELGDKAAIHHQRLGEMVSKIGFEQVVFVGPSWGAFAEGFKGESGNTSNLVTSSTYDEKLAIQMGSMLEQNDFVVIKGSRGMQLERFVPYLNPTNFEAKS